MKKLFLLLVSMSVLFAFGCGSGGSTSTSGSGTSGDTIAAGMGRVSVNFGSESAKNAQALSSNYARIVVRKFGTVSGIDPDTGDPFTVTTTTFQGVADGPIPGTVSLQVPADTGYQIDVLTYAANVDGNGLNAVLKYSSKTAVGVVQGVDNVVLMPALTDCLPADALNLPNPVESGLVYDLRKGKTWNYAEPIRNGLGYVIGSTTAFTNDWFPYSTANNRLDSFVAPPYSAPPATGTVYVQGQFFIDLGLLKPTEQSQAQISKWACYQTVSVAITPPTTVSIAFP